MKFVISYVTKAHFIKKQSLNVFFEEAIISYVTKAHFTKKQSLSVFFEGAIIFYVTKAHFMKKQSLSVYFLKEQLFESLWLLISVADALYFFIKVFTTSKIFIVLACIYTNLNIIVNWW